MIRNAVQLLISVTCVFMFLTPLEAEAASGDSCRALLSGRSKKGQQALERSEALKNWHFSDPLAHSTDSYTYLIHAFRPEVDPIEVYNRIVNPSDNEFKLISASVINEKNQKTFHDVGFIVEASADSIVAANNQDMMIRNNWNEGDSVSAMIGRPTNSLSPLKYDQYVEELYKIWGLPSLEQITTGGNLQNEVAIQRLNSRRIPSLTIKAVFYRRYPVYKPWFEEANVEVKTAASHAAQKLNLPLVEIEVKDVN
jgi:hypothetical protein